MLELEGLHKRFGDVIALDGAGFEVAPGRIVGFLGPNGAGKTTAMRCIFGLIAPDDGRITWKGEPVSHHDRLTFGYMPEERGLYPKMRIREQLVYFAKLSGLTAADASREADGWLDRLGLADRAASRLEELSHGNQQRVQLAVSLVHKPVLAVLDEPFAGLDPIGVDVMAGLLSDLAKTGMGVVFSSHQLDLVEDVCEDVVIIDRGKVVLSGTLESLRHSSGVRHLEVTVDGEDWAPEIPGIEVVHNQGRPRFLVDDATPIADLLRMAQEAGPVTRFAMEPPSLSDLFRQAVGQ